MSGWHFNPVGGYPLVIGAAVVFLVLLLLAGSDLRKLAPRRRMTLIGLRVAIFLAVIGGMLRPTFVFTEMNVHVDEHERRASEGLRIGNLHER